MTDDEVVSILSLGDVRAPLLAGSTDDLAPQELALRIQFAHREVIVSRGRLGRARGDQALIPHFAARRSVVVEGISEGARPNFLTLVIDAGHDRLH